MLDKAKIIEYAIKGVNAEIEEIEKTINQGKKYLKQLENGEKVKTPKTPQEIKNIIIEKNEEIEKLQKFKNELKFEE